MVVDPLGTIKKGMVENIKKVSERVTVTEPKRSACWDLHESSGRCLVYSYFEKGCRKKCARDNPESNMGYDQYTVPDTVAVEPTFVPFR